jgi:hypothetical protein
MSSDKKTRWYISGRSAKLSSDVFWDGTYFTMFLMHARFYFREKDALAALPKAKRGGRGVVESIAIEKWEESE